MDELLQIYRERAGDPSFWAEPFNALTNASFLIAAACGLHLALQKRVLTPSTLSLISLASVIGVGSFLFHTLATPLTMWLDILPIALFQVLFFWLLSREMLRFGPLPSITLVLGIVCASFALMPIKRILDGSLFYLPSLSAVFVLGWLWSRRASHEPWLLMLAGVCFLLAATARTLDWQVPWSIGSHFLWHLLNGGVVYLALRSWILHLASAPASPAPSVCQHGS